MADDIAAKETANLIWKAISGAAGDDNAVTADELKKYHDAFHAKDNRAGEQAVLKELQAGKLPKEGTIVVIPKLSPEHQSLHIVQPLLNELGMKEPLTQENLQRKLEQPAVEHFSEKLKGQVNEPKLREAFKKITPQFDTNNDGNLSLAETLNQLKEIAPKLKVEMSTTTAQVIPSALSNDPSAKQI